MIRNVLHTCIILHNMTVTKRRKDFVSKRVYYHNAPTDTVEEEPLSLFGSLEIAPDGSVIQEAIGSRLYQIDAALHNELEHHGLMYDLKEHIWRKSNNSNVISLTFKKYLEFFLFYIIICSSLYHSNRLMPDVVNKSRMASMAALQPSSLPWCLHIL